MARPLRIGNVCGFWGDRIEAAAEMVAADSNIDYLTLDYLAEVSLSIMAVQRDRNPQLGFARDFVDVITSLIPFWNSGSNVRVVTNGGGLNPEGCARACLGVLSKGCGRSLKVAIVTGDDVLSILQSSPEELQFSNLDTGETLSKILPDLSNANAYTGAQGIIEALSADADIVITGRVADPSLVVGPAAFHHNWSLQDFDALAGATIAGHLIECGTQVTGGISTNWMELPDIGNIGYPVVEVAADGSCVVTKPLGTGGLVDEQTVKEQLLYEMGDPKNFLTPDVTVSIESLTIDPLETNRVQLRGASGREPPVKLKVNATYRAGFRAQGILTVYGRDATSKSRRAAEGVLDRLRRDGCSFESTAVECIGTGVCANGESLSETAPLHIETALRIAVSDSNRDNVDRFTREIAPLVTSGPQGTTGYATGRPRVQPVFGYWPCLIERKHVRTNFQLLESTPASNGILKTRSLKTPPKNLPPATRTITQPFSEIAKNHASQTCENENAGNGNAAGDEKQIHLGEIAHARSGDKGAHANIGIIAYHEEGFQYLQQVLTVDRVQDFFQALGATRVVRYPVPKLNAFNFIVEDVLTLGGSRSVRTDAQGKALGQVILELPLTIPQELYELAVRRR